MGWAIRGLLVFLVVLMMGLLILGVPSSIDPEFQLVWMAFIIIIGTNLLLAIVALFRFSKN